MMNPMTECKNASKPSSKELCIYTGNKNPSKTTPARGNCVATV